MNQICRIIWNDSLGVWQAVSECARGKGKASRSKRTRQLLLISALSVLCNPAMAQLPTGGAVVAGNGSIVQNGNAMTVNQTSDKLAVDWQSFSIGKDNQVNFVQPNAQSVALNRVLGSDVSVIQGALTANGQIFLVNPNGVLFTPTAQVDVGGLVATTLQLSKEDFMAGRYALSGDSLATVSNEGTITAQGTGGQNGFIALVAARVINKGTLNALAGNVALTAANNVLLDLGGPLKIEVKQGAIDALIEQGGAIRANGGTIYLTAQAANELSTSAINVSGVVQADTLGANEQGKIVLTASGSINVSGNIQATGLHGGTISVQAPQVAITAGHLDASGTQQGGTIQVLALQQENGDVGVPHRIDIAEDVVLNTSATHIGNGGVIDVISELTDEDGLSRVAGTLLSKGGAVQGDGGQMEVSGYKVDLAGIRIDALAPNGRAGNLLIDPYDITISTAADNASAGFTATGSGATINTTTLQNALAGANVTVYTGDSGTETGNITVNSTIAWSANTTLTLDAANSVIVNSSITNSGSGSGLTFRSRGVGGTTGAGQLNNSGTLTFLQENASANSIYSGVITGTGTFNKTGAGVLSLSGTNTYTGATTVSAGTLQISGAGSLGGGSYANGIALGAGAMFQYSSSAFQRLTGVISGAGSLVKDTSTSTLMLGTEFVPLTNTYSGGTTLSAGRIYMTPLNDSLLGTGTVTLNGGTLHFDRVALSNDIVNNGATLYLENGFGSSLAGNITNNALLNVVVQFTRQNITGVISGSGGLAVTSLNGGSLVLSGANTYSGSTSVDSGTLQISGAGSLGSGAYVGNIALSNDALFRYSSSAAQTLSGVVSGAGALTKDVSAASTLSLTGANTYSGSTTVDAGTLQIGGAGSLGSGAYAGNIALFNDALFRYSSSAAQTLSGVVSGAGALTKDLSTASTLTLSGNNTYTGATTVSAGTLKAGSTTAFGSNSAVTTNGTLDLNGFDISVGSLAGSGTVSSSTVTTRTLTSGGDNTSTTFSGVIQNGSGTTRFSKTGTGTQTLSGNNTYTGATTVSAGALTLEGAWSVGTGMADVAVAAGSVLSGSGTLTAGQLSVGGLGTVSLTGNNLVGTIAGNGTVGTLTFNNDQSLNVGSMDATGSVLLTSTGAASDLTLSNGAFLTSATTGNAITLAAGRHFINQSNGSVLSTPNGRWLVYSDAPADTVLGELTGFKRYNLSYSASSSSSISQPGNGFVYSIAPVLNIAANSKSRIYGDINPALDGIITGLIDGDTLAAATSGGATYSTAATASNGVGAYAIQADLGTLQSAMGYQFSTQNGTLSIDPRAITVAAESKSKVYGNVDPTLTYSVSSGNLVNGDTLGGVLTRTAGENVGTYSIDASALQNGNYLITAQNGTLGIDPRAITVAAESKSKVYGNVDPTLTYSVSSGNLVNGDTLNGTLSRSIGENVGTYSIDASALQNGNYLITAQNGTLNITTRPLTIPTDAKSNLDSWDNCNLTSCNADVEDLQSKSFSRQLLSVVETPGDTMVLRFSGDSVRLDHLPSTDGGNTLQFGKPD